MGYCAGVLCGLLGHLMIGLVLMIVSPPSPMGKMAFAALDLGINEMVQIAVNKNVTRVIGVIFS